MIVTHHKRSIVTHFTRSIVTINTLHSNPSYTLHSNLLKIQAPSAEALGAITTNTETAMLSTGGWKGCVYLKSVLGLL